MQSFKGISMDGTCLFFVDKDWMMYLGGNPTARPAAIRFSDRVGRSNIVAVKVALRAKPISLSESIS